MPTPAPPATKLIDAHAASILTGERVPTILRLAREGRIPCVRIGTQIRFRLEVIEEIIAHPSMLARTGHAAPRRAEPQLAAGTEPRA